MEEFKDWETSNKKSRRKWRTGSSRAGKSARRPSQGLRDLLEEYSKALKAEEAAGSQLTRAYSDECLIEQKGQSERKRSIASARKSSVTSSIARRLSAKLDDPQEIPEGANPAESSSPGHDRRDMWENKTEITRDESVASLESYEGFRSDEETGTPAWGDEFSFRPRSRSQTWTQGEFDNILTLTKAPSSETVISAASQLSETSDEEMGPSRPVRGEAFQRKKNYRTPSPVRGSPNLPRGPPKAVGVNTGLNSMFSPDPANRVPWEDSPLITIKRRGSTSDRVKIPKRVNEVNEIMASHALERRSAFFAGICMGAAVLVTCISADVTGSTEAIQADRRRRMMFTEGCNESTKFHEHPLFFLASLGMMIVSLVITLFGTLVIQGVVQTANQCVQCCELGSCCHYFGNRCYCRFSGSGMATLFLTASVLTHLLMIGSLVHEMSTCTLHSGASSGIASFAGLFGGFALVLAGWYSAPISQQIMGDLHEIEVTRADAPETFKKDRPLESPTGRLKGSLRTLMGHVA